MVVNTDSIINYRKRKDKRDYKFKSKEKEDDRKESENMVYINVRVRYNSIINIKSYRNCKDDDNKNFEKVVYRDERGRLCAATPYSVIGNRTPPHLLKNIILLKNIKSIFA